jgi:hypothetical protein
VDVNAGVAAIAAGMIVLGVGIVQLFRRKRKP